jgi:hypothetical protein
MTAPVSDPPIDYPYAAASARRALTELRDRVPAFVLRVVGVLVEVTAYVIDDPDEQLLEDLSAAHGEMLSDWPHVTRGEPTIRVEARRADPEWRCLSSGGLVLAGPVWWLVDRAVRAEDPARLAAELFAIADALRAPARGPDQPIDDLLAAAGQGLPPADVPTFRADRYDVEILRPDRMTSVRPDAVRHAWLAASALPADPAAAVDVLRRIEALTRDLAFARGRCAFCGNPVDQVGRDSHYRSCQSCAVSVFRVVY